MNTLETVLKAREILSNATPMLRDCGTLCNAACCQGDEQTGMLLFPEEHLLYEHADFCRIHVLTYTIGDFPAYLLVCNGTCPREERPLACRLFPLFLHMKGTKPTVILDPRARSICPLCSFGIKKLQRPFLDAARQAYDLLLSDPGCKQYLLGLHDLAILEL